MERATSRSCRAPVQTCDNPQDKVGERPDAARLAAVDPYGRSAIGSVTKTFVATVVLQLVAEGKLGLDDSVERRLPGIVPNGAAITLRMLLNHTSGLYNYGDDPPLVAEGEQRMGMRPARWSRPCPTSRPSSPPSSRDA
jgi:CubicO group peptidase (beta-lactamase class C family)